MSSCVIVLVMVLMKTGKIQWNLHKFAAIYLCRLIFKPLHSCPSSPHTLIYTVACTLYPLLYSFTFDHVVTFIAILLLFVLISKHRDTRKRNTSQNSLRKISILGKDSIESILGIFICRDLNSTFIALLIPHFCF